MFTTFLSLTGAQNSIIKCGANIILANLASADENNYFSKYCSKYFDLLKTNKLITISNLAKNAWKIAVSHPKLSNKITHGLLKAERGNVPTKECKNIIAGIVIASFSRYGYVMDRNELDKAAKYAKKSI